MRLLPVTDDEAADIIYRRRLRGEWKKTPFKLAQWWMLIWVLVGFVALSIWDPEETPMLPALGLTVAGTLWICWPMIIFLKVSGRWKAEAKAQTQELPLA